MFNIQRFVGLKLTELLDWKKLLDWKINHSSLHVS